MSEIHSVHSSRIAEHAYHIWEREGRPHGKSLDHWLKAEAELTVAPVAAKNAAPKPARKVAAAKPKTVAAKPGTTKANGRAKATA